jgi:hypothetical protein
LGWGEDFLDGLKEVERGWGPFVSLRALGLGWLCREEPCGEVLAALKLAGDAAGALHRVEDDAAERFDAQGEAACGQARHVERRCGESRSMAEERRALLARVGAAGGALVAAFEG